MSDTTTASKYQLTPAYAAEKFNHEDFNGTLTADNLTDEGAEFFISKGYGHAFVKNGKPLTDAAVAKLKANDDSDDDTASAGKPDAEPTAREKELAAQFDQIKGDMGKAAEAHAATVAELATEKADHATTSALLADAVERSQGLDKAFADEADSHLIAQKALDSEKEAHEATKAQLSEVSDQLTEAQATIAKLTAKLARPKGNAAAANVGDAADADAAK